MNEKMVLTNYLSNNPVDFTELLPPMPPQGFRPIMVFCVTGILDKEQMAAAMDKIRPTLNSAGWVGFIFDGFAYPEVKAFGVPENNLGEFEELKKLIEKISND